MEPQAEMVHWLFATGLLLLGLCLARRGDRRPGGVADAPLARLPLAGARVRARRPDVAGDDLLHQLGDPHDRARHLGPGADGSRAAPSWGSARASSRAAGGGSRCRSAFVVSRRRVPRPRAERVVLRARGVSAPPDRLDVPDRPPLFPLGLASGRGRRCSARASRSRSSRLGDALLRPRHRADLRAPLVRSPGPRTDETAGSSSRSLALVVPGRGLGARDAHARRRRLRSRSSRRRPGTIRLHFDQFVQFPSIQVLEHAGRELRRRRPGRSDRDHRARSARFRPATTPFAGTRSRPTRMSSRASGRSASASGAAADRGLRRERPDATEHVVRWLYFLSFALVIGSLGFRLICLRGLGSRRRLEAPATRSPRIGVIGVIELGILAFCLRCRGRAPAPLRQVPLRRPLADPSGTRFGDGVHRHDARLRAGRALDLPRLAPRAGRAARARARRSRSGPRRGLSVSGHDGVDPGSSWTTELADWVHLSAASLWIGGLVSLVLAVWPAAPICGARPSSASRASRRCSSRSCSPPAPTSRSCGCRTCAISGRTGYGQVLLVKSRSSPSRSRGAAVHHFLVRPRLASARRRLPLPGRAEPRSARAWSAIAVLLAAAILVDSKPPPRPRAAAAGRRSGVEERSAARRRRARSARPRGGSRRTPVARSSRAIACRSSSE